MARVVTLFGLVAVVFASVVLWSWDEDDAQYIDGLQQINDSSDRREVSRVAHVPVKTETPQFSPGGLLLSAGKLEDTDGLDESNSFLVRVVNGTTNEPVEAAIVSVIRMLRDTSGRAWQRMKEDPIAFFRDHGRHFQTGAEGTVRVPKILRNSMLAGIKGKLFSRSYIDLHASREIVLKLVPLRQVSVRVLGFEGLPIPNVEIVLGLTGPTQGFVRNGGLWQRPVIARKRTGGDGIAHLVMTKMSLKRRKKDDLFRVAVNSLLVPDVSITFPLDQIPAAVVDLKLPPTGSIRFLIKGIDGRPCGESIVLHVSERPTGTPYRLVGSGAAFVGTVANGTLTLPGVSCGLELSAHARGEYGSALNAITAQISGPKSPGEISEVTLQFTQEFHRYTCRLVNSEGAPLVNEFIAIRPSYDSLPRLRGFIVPRSMTDEQGRVFGVIDRLFAPDRTVSNRSILFAIRAHGVFPEMAKTIQLPTEPIERSIDFGTVVLDSPELLITGRAVDAAGDPIKFASFHLEPAKKANGVERPQSWSGRSDKLGRFAVYGEFQGSDLSLRVNATGFGTTVVAVNRKDDAGDVVLQKLGGMAGRLVLEDGLRMDEMRVVITANDIRRAKSVTPDKEGTFDFKKITSGGYRLQVLANGKHSVHEIPYVYVAPGMDCNLGEIKVESLGFRLDIEVVRPIVVQRGGVLITVHNPGDGKEVERFTLRTSRGNFFIPINSCDLRLSLADYCPIVLKNVTGRSLRLRFEKGIQLQISRESIFGIPMGLVPHFFIQREGSRDKIWLGKLIRERIIHLKEPGVYQVTGTMSFSDSTPSQQPVALPIRNGRINVVRQEDPQTLTFQLESEAVRLAHEKLKDQSPR